MSGWSQTSTLVASDAASNDYFGLSVALWDGVTVVGAFYDDTSTFDSTGTCRVVFDLRLNTFSF